MEPISIFHAAGLSELLILKVLVKRYPRLQEEQVSCHAAHESHGRILPCGKCEKCRRIIGMLKALDEDPRRCGYSEEQIVRGLSALAESGVKQLGSDAAHLYYLLLVKDWVPSNAHTRKNARPHPEILQLRFDTGRSTLGDLPEFVRKPLFNILRDYADGAVRLREQHWSEFDLDNEMETTPYFIHTDHEDNG